MLWSDPELTENILKFNESFGDCARRESLEEAGIEIHNVQVDAVTNDTFEKEGKHHVAIIMLADRRSGEIHIMEPDRFERWVLFDWGDLPQPLFPSIDDLRKQSFNPFERVS